jgi:N-acetylgalactosamine kinase
VEYDLLRLFMVSSDFTGTAQLIEFVPELKGEKVRLPSNAVFVIANSLVEANKAASDGYNVRVAECRLATWILATKAGLENFEEFSKVKYLQIKLGLNLRKMLDLVQANIHQEPYSAQEVGVTVHKIFCRIP